MKVWIKKRSASLQRAERARSILRQVTLYLLLGFVLAFVFTRTSHSDASIWLLAFFATALGLVCNGVFSILGNLIKKRVVQEKEKQRQSTA